MKRLRRLGGLFGLAFSQLRQDRARTVFAVLGVTFAVLSVTLFIGVGFGVQSTGEQMLDKAQGDLWVSGGPVEVQPSSVGGFQNPIVESHTLSEDIEDVRGVDRAVPMSFQVVYVSTNTSAFQETIGAGLDGGPVTSEGSGFRGPSTHYANGAYDGPMTNQVIVGPETAEKYDLEINDTLYIGGTISNAKQNEFTVVGVSSTFSSLLGTDTVVLRLGELQTLTGTAYADSATLISVAVSDDADEGAVKDAIENAHPDLTVRTNREQFVALLERQAVVIAAGVSLAVLAVFSGTVLSLNLVLSLLYAQRTELTVYRAIGGSRWSLLTVALVEVLCIALVGTGLGLVLTIPAAQGLSSVAAALTGFQGLVQVPLLGYVLGSGVALVFGIVGTAIAIRQFFVSEITRVLGQ